jgi:hypothetical protein
MRSRRAGRMRSAGYVAVMGGTFLVIGGASGMGIFNIILDLVKGQMEAGDMRDNIVWVLNILVWLAALGGITVIAGGYMILKDRERIGKILCIIGTGFGILSLLIGLISALVTSSFDAFVGSMVTFNGLGSLLSMVAQKIA